MTDLVPLFKCTHHWNRCSRCPEPAFTIVGIRSHRGRRTTHQLELALDKFFRWLAERGVTDLQSLTVLHIRDFVPSLKRFRPATLHVHASALRGFLRYLHLKGILDTDLAHAIP